MKNLIIILLCLYPLLFTYTLQAQSCDLSAPTVSICTDESTGETLIVHEDVNLSAPYIIEYIITDDATGSQTGVPDAIISIGSLEDAQTAIDAAAVGESVNVTAIVHNTTHLDQILQDWDICTSGFFSFSLGITPPLQSWQQFYDSFTSANGGVNPNFTIADIEIGFTRVSNGGPWPGGTVELIFDVDPPLPIISCNISEYCYNILPQTSATIGDASNLCPTVGGEDVPTVSEWSLIILGLLTLITGLVSIRQREKTIA